jgi:prepilin-type N-terminal cleavage/methylation domain-containing protein
MKKSAFTLIELIFSMVIIAIAFTVLPKIMQLSTKVSTQGVREEAMYSGIALLGLIHATAWDENNTDVDDILIVSDGNSAYECGSNNYRVGGFFGSRNCQHHEDASALGSDDGDLDDMDDFTTLTASNYNNSREYNLSVNVNYVTDIDESDNSAFSATTNSDTTNTKYITVAVKSAKRSKTLGKTLATFTFHAMNIGQITVNKRAWQ